MIRLGYRLFADAPVNPKEAIVNPKGANRGKGGGKPSSTSKLKATPTNDKILIDFDFNEFKRGMKDTRRRLKKEIELYDRLDQERKRLEDLEKLRQQNLRKIEKARIARKGAILGAVGLAGAGLLGYEALRDDVDSYEDSSSKVEKKR